MAPLEYLIEGSEVHIEPIETESLPRVSFCIPTLNSIRTIERCLQSIQAQSYPEIEIVVVDGYSEDGTVGIATEYADILKFDDGKLGSARQTALEAATGRVVAMFDDDVYLPDPDWLVRAIQYFDYDERVSTVWPTTRAPPGSSLVARSYAQYTSSVIEDRIRHDRGLFGGGNALFRRTHLEEIGGVNPDIHWGEDLDWAKKLRDQGYSVVYLRDPIYHDTMPSLRQFTAKQITAAQSFSGGAEDFMGFSLGDVLYEQFFIGFREMIRGIVTERDLAWVIYPLLLALRILAYVYVGIDRRV